MSGGTDKVMLLIDADNVSVDVMEQAVRLLHQQHGGLHVRRAYCTAESAVKHQATFKRLGIKPMVNLAAGKNSTDIALAVDAIDLVVAERPDVVVIASSDSDFAPLVMRLREKGCVVRGIGQQGKTGDETQDVYDDFTVLAHRKPGGHARAEPRAGRGSRGEARASGRGERGTRGTGRGGRAETPRDADLRSASAPLAAEAQADTAAEAWLPAGDLDAAPLAMPATPELAAEAPVVGAEASTAEVPTAPRKAAAKKSSRRKSAGQAAAAETTAPAEAAAAPAEAAAPATEPAAAAAAEPQVVAPAGRSRRGERQAQAPRAAASAPAASPESHQAAATAPAAKPVAPAPAMPSKVWPDRVRSVLAALPELARGEVVSLRLATERLRDADLLGAKATSPRFFGPLAEHFELLPEDQPQQVRLKR
jgi:uncharacterized protein (TIGR00288 family)